MSEDGMTKEERRSATMAAVVGDITDTEEPGIQDVLRARKLEEEAAAKDKVVEEGSTTVTQTRRRVPAHLEYIGKDPSGEPVGKRAEVVGNKKWENQPNKEANKKGN